MHAAFHRLARPERRRLQREENRRSAAYRARRRRGDLILRIQIDADDIGTLIRYGLLEAGSCRDRATVAAVILRLSQRGFQNVISRT
jgi:hypothetical protein